MSKKGEPDSYRGKCNGCPMQSKVLSEMGELTPKTKAEKPKRPGPSQVHTSYCTGRMTREFSLSAEAIMASLHFILN